MNPETLFYYTATAILHYKANKHARVKYPLPGAHPPLVGDCRGDVEGAVAFRIGEVEGELFDELRMDNVVAEQAAMLLRLFYSSIDRYLKTVTFARSNIWANDICEKYWQPILT